MKDLGQTDVLSCVYVCVCVSMHTICHSGQRPKISFLTKFSNFTSWFLYSILRITYIVSLVRHLSHTLESLLNIVNFPWNSLSILFSWNTLSHPSGISSDGISFRKHSFSLQSTLNMSFFCLLRFFFFLWKCIHFIFRYLCVTVEGKSFVDRGCVFFFILSTVQGTALGI